MKRHRPADRRRHPRLPVCEGLIEPITLAYAATPKAARGAKAPRGAAAPKGTQPAILTNLSAGGMSLITFVEPPHARVLRMDMSLPGLSHVPLEGKVVRVHSKGETFKVGIEFTQIHKKHQKLISDMALDNLDCDTRISLGLPEACMPACRFHPLCQKPQKAPHWPPKA